MSFTPSSVRSKNAARRRARPYWITALYVVWLSAVLTFLPVIYRALPKPALRLFVFALLVAFSLSVFCLLLRYLFRRLHGVYPAFRELLPAVAAVVAVIIAAMLISLLCSAFLFSVLRLPVSDETRFGTEAIVAAVLNALTYPLFLSAPLTALRVGSFGHAFWRQLWKALQKGYFPIFAAAVVFFGLNLLFTSVFPNLLGSFISVFLTTLLHVFSIEWELNLV